MKRILLVVLIIVIAVMVFNRRDDDPNLVRNVDMLGNATSTQVITQSIAYATTTRAATATSTATTTQVLGWYAEPQEPGNYPGVILIHEWWGLNDHMKQMAGELAKEGYKVLAVDLYNGQIAATSSEAQKLSAAVRANPTAALRNMKAAAAYLRTQEGVTKLASLGWCFGGGQSLQLSLSDEKLDGTIIYYGQLETDPNKLKAIDEPVLGIFGEKDTSIPTTTVQKFEKALNDLGKKNEVIIYPGVGHAFANPSGMNYSPEPTKDAWAKTLQFLAQNLKS